MAFGYSFKEKVFRPIAIHQNGRATAVLYDPAKLALDGLNDSLWKTITLHPFPFRRCPTCKKIFVISVKKQKFCDKKCANKAAGPRNEYMKVYMRDRRELAKTQDC